MHRIGSNKNSQKFVFWLSRPFNCLSFHSAPAYERIDFLDYATMWQMVHEFVEQGYTVQ